MKDQSGIGGLADWLAAPERVAGIGDIAQGWRDEEAVFILAPVPSVDWDFGAHLRRSFLAALNPGASPAARSGAPCPWDAPCALDVFLREQLRSGGDGLPKPYVIGWQQEGPALAVTLRVFGTACDWFTAAVEAMTAALQDRLPWDKALTLRHGPPRLLDRRLHPAQPLPMVPEGPLTLRLASPMDDEGANPGQRDIAAALLSRAVRRVDAVARWQGLALMDDALRALTASAHAVSAQAVRLTHETRNSPNAKGQRRSTRVLLGEIDLPPLPPGLRLLLALTSRTQLGRHTNEGLGALEVLATKPVAPMGRLRAACRRPTGVPMA